MFRLVLSIALATVAGEATASENPAPQAGQSDSSDPTAAADGQGDGGDGGPSEAPEEGAVEELEITKMPKLRTFYEADYPAEAFEQGIQAEVTLEIDIDAEGAVEAATVLVPAQATGYGFDEAALMAVQMFEFEPAEAGGVPIPVRISYKYRFAIAAPEPEPEEEAPPPDPVLNFTGKLVQRGSTQILAGILVTVFRGEGEDTVGFEAVSNAEGVFEFFDLEPGDWKVLIEPEGFYPYRTIETIAEGELTETTYYVEKGSYNPFDILVEAKRPRKEVNRTTIAAAEVDKVPGTFGDVLSVVQNLPGVARLPAGGLVIVRGSAPEDTQIFVDGVTVPLIYHFGGLRSVIPTGMLQNIDFYPGNFSTYYSRATGGILDIGLKRLRPDDFGGYVDVSLLDTSFFLETPLGEDGAIAVGGRQSYIGAVLNAAVPDDAPVEFVTAPKYQDFEVLGQYRLKPGHNLEVFFIASDDQLEVLFQNPGDLAIGSQASGFGASTRFYRGLIEYEYVPSPTFSNTFKTALGRDWIDFELGPDLFFNLDFYLAQVRDTIRWDLNDEIRLVAGTNYYFGVTDIDIRLPPPPKEGEPQDGPPDFNDIQRLRFEDEIDHLVGLFTELEYKPFEGTLIIPGVRFDYITQTRTSTIAPRVATRLELDDAWTLKGGVGYFYQPPLPDESADAFGNPDLGPEGAIHYSVGAEYNLTDYLTFDATLFYKDLFDVVARTDAVVERDGETVPLNYTNEGDGRVYGAELLIRHKFANNFFGWLSYTFSVAERQDAPGEAYRPFDFDQTHILTALGTYQLPRNWEVGFRWRIVTGNPSTPALRSIFNSDLDLHEPIYGPTNSDRLPAFHQLDIRVDKKWIYDSWILNAYLDVQNTYDRSNTEQIAYNYDYTIPDPQSGLPILPVLGLRAEF